ncbi:MAG: tRNA pseudouridine(38-40) synthase TruA [Saprospiraceae bacterium]
MRYFLTLSYLGTRYAGWQIQPNAPSVQATIETALGVILRQPIEVTGCGRTDAGVHARDYVAHFDFDGALPPTFLNGANSLLPPDIALHQIRTVAPDAHARFDAYERSYEYQITLRKDPFLTETAWFFAQGRRLDLEKMQAVADLLPRFEQFQPFCKTDSGLDSFHCQLKSARWAHDRERLVFHITANRFLRGMVRLIVGACVNAGLGKIAVADVQTALERQTPIPKSFSVPPQGLCLTGIKYPFFEEATA